jgi:hypothetical protein
MSLWCAVPESILLGLLGDITGKYTEPQAFLSLTVDYNKQAQVSIKGYRSVWGWSHDRVKNFITNSGLELVRICPENKKSLSILKPATKRPKTDPKATYNRPVNVIIFDRLANKTTHDLPTTDPKPVTPIDTGTPKTINHHQTGGKEDLIGEYLAYGLRFGGKNGGPPDNPEGWANSVKSRLYAQGGLTELDHQQFKNWRKKERIGQENSRLAQFIKVVGLENSNDLKRGMLMVEEFPVDSYPQLLDSSIISALQDSGNINLCRLAALILKHGEAQNG